MTDAVSQFTVLRSLSTSQPDPFLSIPRVARVVLVQCSLLLAIVVTTSGALISLQRPCACRVRERFLPASNQDFALDRGLGGDAAPPKFASLYLFGVRASVARLSNPSRAWGHKLEREGQGIEK
jgi:hypothetical protein